MGRMGLPRWCGPGSLRETPAPRRPHEVLEQGRGDSGSGQAPEPPGFPEARDGVADSPLERELGGDKAQTPLGGRGELGEQSEGRREGGSSSQSSGARVHTARSPDRQATGRSSPRDGAMAPGLKSSGTGGGKWPVRAREHAGSTLAAAGARGAHGGGRQHPRARVRHSR